MQRQLAQQQELHQRKRCELERVSLRWVTGLFPASRCPEHRARYHGNNPMRPSLRCAVLRERVNLYRCSSALEWQIRQLQKGQHETFVFLGNLASGSRRTLCRRRL